MFEGKCILLGVTGSISVYKAVDLASKLTQAGILVDVVMTESATRFVSPLTFRSVTHREIYTDMWAPVTEYNVKHVSLAERADVIIIAPATANTIAHIASGYADDLLQCTVLSTRAPIAIAPAMDVGMYLNDVTQENLSKLKSRGFTIIGPASGYLASGLEGPGRLVEVPELLASVYQVLGKSGDMAGKRIIVTAGGTQEPIDPVRFIGNYSSGKMGAAIAEAARNRGADVTFIHASISVHPPLGTNVVKVQTAEEMRNAVLEETAACNALIMAAAIADYKPDQIAGNKIKRKDEGLSLQLAKTADILCEVPATLVKVGFAAESQELLENARKKLESKGLDMIVANDITSEGSGFGTETNEVTIIDRNGNQESLPMMSKSAVAHKILDRIADLI